MRRVIDLAVRNAESGRGGPFAALVVRDGRVISEGTNLVTSSNDPTAHAEIVAIRRACEALNSFQLDRCDLYTSCEPCPMCLGAIYWARPARIFYAATRMEAAAAGFDDEFIYEEIDARPESRRLPMVRLLADQAELPFDAWRSFGDRVRY
ncbi:MAG: nucleoside deaminase [Rhodothermales bacterium]|nr:nucleoside deaminase [Rhodothermales bacterium]